MPFNHSSCHEYSVNDDPQTKNPFARGIRQRRKNGKACCPDHAEKKKVKRDGMS